MFLSLIVAEQKCVGFWYMFLVHARDKSFKNAGRKHTSSV